MPMARSHSGSLTANSAPRSSGPPTPRLATIWVTRAGLMDAGLNLFRRRKVPDRLMAGADSKRMRGSTRACAPPWSQAGSAAPWMVASAGCGFDSVAMDMLVSPGAWPAARIGLAAVANNSPISEVRIEPRGDRIDRTGESPGAVWSLIPDGWSALASRGSLSLDLVFLPGIWSRRVVVWRASLVSCPTHEPWTLQTYGCGYAR